MPLVADLFLYSYEADFVQHLQKSLSLNNPKFNDYIDVIYPKELEIKDTTDAPKWANQIKSNQIYFSTTFNIAFMCTLLHYYNLKFISIMIVNV